MGRILSDVASGVFEYFRESGFKVRQCTHSQYDLIIQNATLVNPAWFIGIHDNCVIILTITDKIIGKYDLSDPNSLPMAVNCINDYLVKEYGRAYR